MYLKTEGKEKKKEKTTLSYERTISDKLICSGIEVYKHRIECITKFLFTLGLLTIHSFLRSRGTPTVFRERGERYIYIYRTGNNCICKKQVEKLGKQQNSKTTRERKKKRTKSHTIACVPKSKGVFPLPIRQDKTMIHIKDYKSF